MRSSARDQVRGFSTRNPVVAQHWIPDRVRDDKLLVRDDKLLVRDDKLLVRDDKLLVWDDKLLSLNGSITQRTAPTSILTYDEKQPREH